MEKMNYTAPEFELVLIPAEDIITTSIGDKPFLGEDDDLSL